MLLESIEECLVSRIKIHLNYSFYSKLFKQSCVNKILPLKKTLHYKMLCYNITMNRSKNIIRILKKSYSPMSAYDILNEINRTNNVQPMTIYRALEKLMKAHKIHKCRQTKKYFICDQDHEIDTKLGILFCDNCGKTEEFNTDIISKQIMNKDKSNFNFNNFQIEISAICKDCV